MNLFENYINIHNIPFIWFPLSRYADMYCTVLSEKGGEESCKRPICFWHVACVLAVAAIAGVSSIAVFSFVGTASGALQYCC